MAVDVVLAIQEALAGKNLDALLSLSPTLAQEEKSINDGFTGSIMPDETLMGQIDLELMTEAAPRGFRL